MLPIPETPRGVSGPGPCSRSRSSGYTLHALAGHRATACAQDALGCRADGRMRWVCRGQRLVETEGLCPRTCWERCRVADLLRGCPDPGGAGSGDAAAPSLPQEPRLQGGRPCGPSWPSLGLLGPCLGGSRSGSGSWHRAGVTQSTRVTSFVHGWLRPHPQGGKAAGGRGWVRWHLARPARGVTV